jgi:hypothetical protein
VICESDPGNVQCFLRKAEPGDGAEKIRLDGAENARLDG